MGIRKSPEETKRRREEVKDFMETVGPYSVPIKVLAEKYNVTVKVIYNDINFWIKKLDFSKMDNEGKKLLMGIKKNIGLVEAMRLEGKTGDRLKAIKIANETAEVYTKLMEQFGFKEKVAEKHQVEGVSTFNLIEKSVEEIKDAKVGNKKKRTDNKPEASRDVKSS